PRALPHPPSQSRAQRTDVRFQRLCPPRARPEQSSSGQKAAQCDSDASEPSHGALRTYPCRDPPLRRRGCPSSASLWRALLWSPPSLAPPPPPPPPPPPTFPPPTPA